MYDIRHHFIERHLIVYHSDQPYIMQFLSIIFANNSLHLKRNEILL